MYEAGMSARPCILFPDDIIVVPTGSPAPDWGTGRIGAKLAAEMAGAGRMATWFGAGNKNRCTCVAGPDSRFCT